MLDFGVNGSQSERLRREQVTRWQSRHHGRTYNLQCREVSAFLAAVCDADQVAYGDCVDLAFQAGIAPVITSGDGKLKAKLDFTPHGTTLGVGGDRPERLDETRHVSVECFPDSPPLREPSERRTPGLR